MLHSIVFSPSGTTAKVANIFTDSLGYNKVEYDLTLQSFQQIMIDGKDEIAVFAMPVYAGRIPAIAAKRLNSVRGNGQKAIAIVVYGNRDYDDALVELCDLISSNGFQVIAAGAFIAQHCIFPKVATGRPDAGDIEKISIFANSVRDKINRNETLDIDSVKGNRPYKKPASVPLHPNVDEKKCNSCNKCASQCPTGAISPDNPKKTDGSKCITCCRCINICPHDARHFEGILYKIAGWKFVKDNSRRLEPEWFVD